MKKLKKFLIFLVAMYVLGQFTMADSKFDRSMKSQLDFQTATGTKIVTYHVEDEKYSDYYLPRSLAAKKASDVGAVLQITTEQTYRQYGMNGAVWKYADILTLTLVDCDTQTIIDARTYYPTFPSKSNGSIKYDTKAMKEWIDTNWTEYLEKNG